MKSSEFISYVIECPDLYINTLYVSNKILQDIGKKIDFTNSKEQSYFYNIVVRGIYSNLAFCYQENLLTTNQILKFVNYLDDYSNPDFFVERLNILCNLNLYLDEYKKIKRSSASYCRKMLKKQNMLSSLKKISNDDNALQNFCLHLLKKKVLDLLEPFISKDIDVRLKVLPLYEKIKNIVSEEEFINIIYCTFATPEIVFSYFKHYKDKSENRMKEMLSIPNCPLFLITKEKQIFAKYDFITSFASCIIKEETISEEIFLNYLKEKYQEYIENLQNIQQAFA